MPINFSVGDVIEILRRGGKTTLVNAAGTIAASSSLGAAPTPPSSLTPHVQIDLSVPKDKVMLTERFNWGKTSGTGVGGAITTDAIFYEIHLQGRPPDPEGRPLPDFFGQETGYYCGVVVRPSCVDNYCTHVLAAESITLKLWNISSPAVAADWDFTLWYILLKKQDFQELRAYFSQQRAQSRGDGR